MAEPAAADWIGAIGMETNLSQALSSQVYQWLQQYWQVYAKDPPSADFEAKVVEIGDGAGWVEEGT